MLKSAGKVDISKSKLGLQEASVNIEIFDTFQTLAKILKETD